MSAAAAVIGEGLSRDERRRLSHLWRNRAKHLNLRARVHRAGYLSPADLREIVRRDGSRCVYCKKELDYTRADANGRNDSSFDHIIRLVDGGSHSYENVCCSCRSCNQRNAARSITDPTGEAHDRLRRFLARKP